MTDTAEELHLSYKESVRKKQLQEALEKYCKEKNINLNELGTSERGELVTKIEGRLWW